DLIEREARSTGDIGGSAQLRVIEYLDAHPSMQLAVERYLEAIDRDSKTLVITSDGRQQTRGEERAQEAASVAQGQITNLTGNTIGAAIQGIANEICDDPAAALRYAQPFVTISEWFVLRFEAREAGEEKARAVGEDVESGKFGEIGARG